MTTTATTAMTTASGTAGEPSDWELVCAAQAGDREAFGRLYRRYERKTARFIARRWGRDRCTVDDLTSETFLTAWRTLGGLERDEADSDARVWRWLRSIAEYRVLNQYTWGRRHRTELVGERTELDEQLHGNASYETGPYGGYSPEALALAGIDREAIAHAVHTALPTLTPPRRRCMQLRYFEHHTVAETAQIMGRSPVTVEGLHRRATLELAAVLDPDSPPRQPGRYPVVLERARTAHAGRVRHPQPAAPPPPGGAEAAAALAECTSKTELLHVAWRFLGQTDVPPAIRWLRAHGYQIAERFAYSVRHDLAANQAPDGDRGANGGVASFPPDWARRLRALRKARGWTHAQAAEQLRAHTGQPLPEPKALTRRWQLWEHGQYTPDAFYRRLIAAVFATETASEAASPSVSESVSESAA